MIIMTKDDLGVLWLDLKIQELRVKTFERIFRRPADSEAQPVKNSIGSSKENWNSIFCYF